MYKIIREIISLLPAKSRINYFLLFFLRSILGLLDLFGILLMGLLVAKASQSLGISTSIAYLERLSSISLTNLVVLVLATFLLKSLLSVYFMKVMLLSLAKSEAKISANLFGRILNSSGNKVGKHSKQSLIFGVNSAATASITNLLGVLATIVSESILLLIILITFSFVDLQMTLAILFYFALIGITLQRSMNRKNRSLGRKFVESNIKSSLVVEDSLSAFKEIFATGKQDFFVNKFFNYRREFATYSANSDYILALPRYVVEPALMIGAVILAAFSINNENGFESLGIFLTGGLRIMAAMLPLQFSLGKLARLRGECEKLLDLNQFFKESGDPIGKQKIENKSVKSISGGVGVELLNLSFQYEESGVQVLKNVSTRIEPGSNVAIIGPSGSGKSTLADLLIGILKSNQGQIRFFNLKNESLPRDTFTTGYVPQNPGIVSGSIAENIALGIDKENIDMLKINQVIANTGLSNFIETLSESVDTSVGEQQNDLSGGQLQRLSLARALYLNPNLIILDEATSALDMESEDLIGRSLQNLRGSVTVLIIAHRLSTVKMADSVLVLDSGEIVASGKFQELAKSSNLVSKYVELANLDL